MLWQLTLTILRLGRPFTGLGFGTFSGEDACSGSPGELTDPSENKEESWVDWLSCLRVLNRVELIFLNPQFPQSHTADSSPSLPYSVELMFMQVLCNHSSHPSHCRASAVQLTSVWQSGHGNAVTSCSALLGPGLISTSPDKSRIMCTRRAVRVLLFISVGRGCTGDVFRRLVTIDACVRRKLAASRARDDANDCVLPWWFPSVFWLVPCSTVSAAKAKISTPKLAGNVLPEVGRHFRFGLP